jgi:aminodeoxyfutalosine synthase
MIKHHNIDMSVDMNSPSQCLENKSKENNADKYSLALDKGQRCERLTVDEAMALESLFNPDGMYLLMRSALENRRRRFGEKATFVSNIQINPSNLCEGTCGFCRYRAKEGDAHAYVLSEQEIFERIDTASPAEVHIVGGMNRIWNFDRNLRLVRDIRTRFPFMHIKAFTAVEIDYFARTAGCSSIEILQSLKDAGLNALPGGGAELFSDRMRDNHCPSKLKATGWLRIHREAHELGIPTNATMLYGLGESFEERVRHLIMLRDLEDEAPGFSCFVPLPFQTDGANEGSRSPSPQESLLVIALARLVLDNFSHIKAYWPMIGEETAAMALSFGADDLDGTIQEERIAHAAGSLTPKALTKSRMEETIRLGGFLPIERGGVWGEGQ